MSFAHLHVHSQYSILYSSASISGLLQKAKQHNMSSIALTDSGNMFGSVDFFISCRKANIQPILGLEIVVAPTSRFEKKKVEGKIGYPIILLAKTRAGYQTLCRIASAAYTDGFYYVPRIDKEFLESNHTDLICLSGPLSSIIGQLIINDNREELKREIDWFQKVFKDDFFFEISTSEMTDTHLEKDGFLKESWLKQRYINHIHDERKYVQEIISLAKTSSVGCVATNPIHYLEREDWLSHEILLNIQSGQPREIWENDPYGKPKSRVLNPKRDTFITHEHYFKSALEMETQFSYLSEAIQNSLFIAAKCQVDLVLDKRFYPVFMPTHLEGKKIAEEERQKEVQKYLRDQCEAAINERYTSEKMDNICRKYSNRSPVEIIKERLEYELNIIFSRDMCDYLLIVHDFISWAKNRGIPVGPGRGSGAGSIILYLLGITDIEPLYFNLFFERFINPERPSYPDIDVDICMERRSEVIDYTIQKYGRDKVAQIITFGTMKAKMAIKDVGRVLNIPLTKVNMIAKLIPEDLAITLDLALESSSELALLYREDVDIRNIFDIAKKLEGCIRNTGIHAAGIIICANSLIDHIPICKTKDSEISITQYSMKLVEKVGLLKIDLLGLKTLTSIQKAVDAIAITYDGIDWRNLPLNDQKTFALLNQGKTLGVFQLESTGMQELARNLHIDKFEEVIAAISLYRPGPMEMIPAFIHRKLGQEFIEYDHPWMEEILEETYGIMIYQEQVMQIASKLAGYSLGEGDVLRRAMGKKDHVEMAQQREKFCQGALQLNISEKLSAEIFDKVQKFASYGFNKSHAAAYGYVSYVTAYLKANYPKEWLAALMSCDMDDLSKVAKYVRECHTMQISILPPDINESGIEFVATPKGIRFSLVAIKGVGKNIVDSILLERKKRGNYKNLQEFIERIDTKKIGKKTLETLIITGCFDYTGVGRNELIASIDKLYEISVKKQKELSRGIVDFLDLLPISHKESLVKEINISEKYSKSDFLIYEKTLLGLYVTGHPMDEHAAFIQKLGCISLDSFGKNDNYGIVKTAFILEKISIKSSNKTGKKFAILLIGNGVEQFELPVWSDLFHKYKDQLVENQLFISILAFEREGGRLKLTCKWLSPLRDMEEKKIEEMEREMIKVMEAKPREKSNRSNIKANHKLRLQLNADSMRLSEIRAIKKIFDEYPGNTAVDMEFVTENSKKIAIITIDERSGISASEDMCLSLRKKVPSIVTISMSEEPKL